MTTPRIEEIARCFCKNTPRMRQEGGVTFYNRLVVALTQAHQEGYADGYKQGKFDAEVTAKYGEPEALQDNE